MSHLGFYWSHSQDTDLAGAVALLAATALKAVVSGKMEPLMNEQIKVSYNSQFIV